MKSKISFSYELENLETWIWNLDMKKIDIIYIKY